MMFMTKLCNCHQTTRYKVNIYNVTPTSLCLKIPAVNTYFRSKKIFFQYRMLSPTLGHVCMLYTFNRVRITKNMFTKRVNNNI